MELHEQDMVLSKQEMELFKQEIELFKHEMELFLYLPDLSSIKFIYKMLPIWSMVFKVIFKHM